MRTIVGAERALATEVGRTLARAGVRGRYVTCGTVIGYEYSLPTSRGLLRARAWVMPPTEVAGRFRRRLKKKLRKFVKKKALGVLKKVAKKVASYVPYGSAVVDATEMAVKAGKAIKRARVSGDPALTAATVRALDAESARLRRQRMEWR